jgi:short-chain fatty acids transporter
MANHIDLQNASFIPDVLSFEQTVFSSMNAFVFVATTVLIPVLLYFIGTRVKPGKISLPSKTAQSKMHDLIGMEKVDHSTVASKVIGLFLVGFAIYKFFVLNENNLLGFFTPNNINFTLLGLGILSHRSFHHFVGAVDEAIGGVAGILIQFPLYFGIMGLMRSSGMVEWISDFFVHISNGTTYPIFTFISAGIINIFVPSGGGQWAVQGPIIIQAASELDVSLSKCILAMAYGDQVTNMLQPFWALPLLGITGLKAREILPYTALLFLLSSLIFVTALLIF